MNFRAGLNPIGSFEFAPAKMEVIMAQVMEFTFEALPKTVEELKSLPEADLSTPFKTAALTVLALIRYAESVEDCHAMLEFLNGPREMSAYDKQFLRDRLREKDYVPKSYLAGTNPQNDYTPSQPYRISVSDQVYSYVNEGYAKLFMTSSGADTPRPIVMRQKDDKWYMWEQFLLPDIRKPASKSDW